MASGMLVLSFEAAELQARKPARLIVQSKTEARIELRVTGCLPRDWSQRFAAGLARLRINLLSGYARRSERDDWIGAFEAELPLERPEALDLESLTQAPGPYGANPHASILDFRLQESTRLGGCLEVELAAWDSVGLLAATLESAHAAGLRPAELLLETQEGCAFQQLSLQTAIWTCPSPRQQRELGRYLAARLGAV